MEKQNPVREDSPVHLRSHRIITKSISKPSILSRLDSFDSSTSTSGYWLSQIPTSSTIRNASVNSNQLTKSSDFVTLAAKSGILQKAPSTQFPQQDFDPLPSQSQDINVFHVRISDIRAVAGIGAGKQPFTKKLTVNTVVDSEQAQQIRNQVVSQKTRKMSIENNLSSPLVTSIKRWSLNSNSERSFNLSFNSQLQLESCNTQDRQFQSSSRLFVTPKGIKQVKSLESIKDTLQKIEWFSSAPLIQLKDKSNIVRQIQFADEHAIQQISSASPIDLLKRKPFKGVLKNTNSFRTTHTQSTLKLGRIDKSIQSIQDNDSIFESEKVKRVSLDLKTPTLTNPVIKRIVRNGQVIKQINIIPREEPLEVRQKK